MKRKTTKIPDTLSVLADVRAHITKLDNIREIRCVCDKCYNSSIFIDSDNLGYCIAHIPAEELN